jgi:hypothetical protein
MKPEFKRKALKGLIIASVASLLATGAYYGTKKLDQYMLDQMGKSAADWFETYYHIPKK